MKPRVDRARTSVLWETPLPVFRELDAEFHFTLDVCANGETAKCERHFASEDDAMLVDWPPVACFMNPPYGHHLDRWVKKAVDSALRGSTVVALLPASTDTRWFHAYVLPLAEIRFIKSRLHFSDRGRAPFPSMVAIWRGDGPNRLKIPVPPWGTREFDEVHFLRDQVSDLVHALRAEKARRR